LWIRDNGWLKVDSQNAQTGQNDYLVERLDPLGVGINLKAGASSPLGKGDRAMKYTDGRGHLRLDAFVLAGVVFEGVPPKGKGTSIEEEDQRLSQEIIRNLQEGGYLDDTRAFTPKFYTTDLYYDHWNDWGFDEISGKPLEKFLNIDRKFSFIYAEISRILRQAAEEMKVPNKPQPMPINSEPGTEGEPVNQVYWTVQVQTPQGDRPFIVHIRNSYNKVVPVNSHREADYQIFVTSQKEYQERGLHWDDLCGHVVLKFNEGNILSNPSLEVQVGLRFRQKFPWLFGFVKERLAEELQKPFDISNTGLSVSPERAKKYNIDATALDVETLEEDYNVQFSAFLDAILAVAGFDVAKLNAILSQDSKYYKIKWDYRGMKLLQEMFNSYFRGMLDPDFNKLNRDFPSLSGLWLKLKTGETSDLFGDISAWMINQYKELSAKNMKEELFWLKSDATRLIQTIIVKEYVYIPESTSIAKLVSNRSWNCWSISCLTAVLMGLWGIPGVSVVEVTQLADGIRLPLPGGIGHAANLVREGGMAAYIDQGLPPQFSKVRVKVILLDSQRDVPIEGLHLVPGAQGLDMYRIFELYKAQNDFKRILDKLKKCPGIEVHKRGNVTTEMTNENAGEMIQPLEEVVDQLEGLSLRMINEPGGSISILALDWQWRGKVDSILNTLGGVLIRAKREVALQQAREKERQRRAFAQSAGDLAMMGEKGGIDLTPAHMNLQTKMDSRFRGNDKEGNGNDREGITFHLDPAQLAQLRNAPGFVPVIISVWPLSDLRQFLGISQKGGNL